MNKEQRKLLSLQRELKQIIAYYERAIRDNEECRQDMLKDFEKLERMVELSLKEK